MHWSLVMTFVAQRGEGNATLSVPIDNAGTTPMSKRGEVEFWLCHFPPNLEHVPKPNVVEDDQCMGR